MLHARAGSCGRGISEPRRLPWWAYSLLHGLRVPDDQIHYSPALRMQAVSWEIWHRHQAHIAAGFHRSLQWRQRAHIGNERVEVGFRHVAVMDLTRHRKLEATAVARHTLGEGTLDLRIGPGADSCRRV